MRNVDWDYEEATRDEIMFRPYRLFKPRIRVEKPVGNDPTRKFIKTDRLISCQINADGIIIEDATAEETDLIQYLYRHQTGVLNVVFQCFITDQTIQLVDLLMASGKPLVATDTVKQITHRTYQERRTWLKNSPLSIGGTKIAPLHSLDQLEENTVVFAIGNSPQYDDGYFVIAR